MGVPDWVGAWVRAASKSSRQDLLGVRGGRGLVGVIENDDSPEIWGLLMSS